LSPATRSPTQKTANMLLFKKRIQALVIARQRSASRKSILETADLQIAV
jgi:hypothetical protein